MYITEVSSQIILNKLNRTNKISGHCNHLMRQTQNLRVDFFFFDWRAVLVAVQNKIKWNYRDSNGSSISVVTM